jgi:hypothetical protein
MSYNAPNLSIAHGQGIRRERVNNVVSAMVDAPASRFSRRLQALITLDTYKAGFDISNGTFASYA